MNFKPLGVFAILLIGGWASYFLYNKFAYESYERGMVDSLSSMFEATQESYKKEFNTYNLNSEELKKLLFLTNEVVGFASVDEIPEELSTAIKIEDKPYIDKNSYKIIIFINSQKYNRQAVWSFDNLGNKKLVYRKSKLE